MGNEILVAVPATTLFTTAYAPGLSATILRDALELELKEDQKLVFSTRNAHFKSMSLDIMLNSLGALSLSTILSLADSICANGPTHDWRESVSPNYARTRRPKDLGEPGNAMENAIVGVEAGSCRLYLVPECSVDGVDPIAALHRFEGGGGPTERWTGFEGFQQCWRAHRFLAAPLFPVVGGWR
ncbi:hypothetical protein FA15DRAFT_698627 [Coprinopsis marcescibilis]|uniref:Uncharacterized protein n=1 Tax=Coprinopsis marcescibilis TaxID=230819 RepID=A0A5C3KAK6_COPMA|nr:hypothetical protein FA15DRAFT_698627 [Coprinopsis marcescibilis]